MLPSSRRQFTVMVNSNFASSSICQPNIAWPRPSTGPQVFTGLDLSAVRQSDSELAVVTAQTFPASILIERAGPSTRKKFFEFFTVPIRNANTRAAYYRAIQQFMTWLERAGYQHLEDIEPITVAAYIDRPE